MEKNDSLNSSKVSTNPEECWKMYKKVLEETKSLDDYLEEECNIQTFNEGEEEMEWLKIAGLEELTEPWKQGREVLAEELLTTLSRLSHAQAETVKRRVRSLNHTVRQRYNQRQKGQKPNIRDVFHDPNYDASNVSKMNRRAAHDSQDSVPAKIPENSLFSLPSFENNIKSSYENSSILNFHSVLPRNAYPLQDIFKRSGQCSYRDSVAKEDSGGIKLMAYQKFGTINLSQSFIQRLSNCELNEVANDDMDPTKHIKSRKDLNLRDSRNYTTVTLNNGSLPGSAPQEDNIIYQALNNTRLCDYSSFEEIYKIDSKFNNNRTSDNLSFDENQAGQGIELLSQKDLIKLQSLLWLELTTIFDKFNLSLIKKKPSKKRQKSGNLFGVSLSTLILRDNQLTNEESNVPLIFRKILDELSNRGIKEEGILRVAGPKQKVESLCAHLEMHFYNEFDKISELLNCTPCHDLTAVLKKMLRDLPQPVLTLELMDAYYQTHGIKDPKYLSYSLNLLVLLLPSEHRCTLKALLSFLRLIIENQNSNKMSIHNVSMIIAPSLFPPRYVYSVNRIDLGAQIYIAAMCCQITEAIILNFDKLWNIPRELNNQLQQQIREDRHRRYKKNNNAI